MTFKTNCFALALTAAAGLLGCKKSEPVSAPAEAAAPSKSVEPATAVELKLKLPVGARFTQRLELSQSSEGIVATMPTPAKQEVSLGQEFHVAVLREREGGGRELELQFGDSEISVSMNGREVMTFDSRGESAGDAENPVAKSFRAMVGAPIKLQLDGSNRVEKVEGVPELTSRMAGGGARAQRSFLAGLWTEDYFKQMGDFGSGLPGHPVKSGDRWPVRKDIVMGPLGAATLNLTYTFIGWEPRAQRQCARLDFTGSVSGKSAGGAAPMGATTAIQDGQAKGRLWFDPELGQTIESESEQTMTMLMTFAGGASPDAPAPPGGTTVTNLMMQKFRKTLLPIQPK